MPYHLFIDGAKEPTETARSQLADQVATRFGIPRAAIHERLRTGRVRVKAGVDLATARRFAAELELLGAVCSIVNAAAAPTEPAPTEPAPTVGAPPAAAPTVAAPPAPAPIAAATKPFSLGVLDNFGTGPLDAALLRLTSLGGTIYPKPDSAPLVAFDDPAHFTAPLDDFDDFDDFDDSARRPAPLAAIDDAAPPDPAPPDPAPPVAAILPFDRFALPPDERAPLSLATSQGVADAAARALAAWDEQPASSEGDGFLSAEPIRDARPPDLELVLDRPTPVATPASAMARKPASADEAPADADDEDEDEDEDDAGSPDASTARDKHTTARDKRTTARATAAVSAPHDNRAAARATSVGTTPPQHRRKAVPRVGAGPLGRYPVGRGHLRVVCGVAFALLLGYLPATIYAQSAESSRYPKLRRPIEAAQAGPLTPEAWDRLIEADGPRAGAVQNLARARDSIRTTTLLIWVLGSGALGWAWFRRLT